MTQVEIDKIKYEVYQRLYLLSLNFEEAAQKIGVNSYDLKIFDENTAMKAKKWLDDVLWDD